MDHLPRRRRTVDVELLLDVDGLDLDLRVDELQRRLREVRQRKTRARGEIGACAQAERQLHNAVVAARRAAEAAAVEDAADAAPPLGDVQREVKRLRGLRRWRLASATLAVALLSGACSMEPTVVTQLVAPVPVAGD